MNAIFYKTIWIIQISKSNSDSCMLRRCQHSTIYSVYLFVIRRGSVLYAIVSDLQIELRFMHASTMTTFHYVFSLFIYIHSLLSLSFCISTWFRPLRHCLYFFRVKSCLWFLVGARVLVTHALKGQAEMALMYHSSSVWWWETGDLRK